MHRLFDADPRDRFVIYVNDHRGLLIAEAELAKRSHRSNCDNGGDSELVTLLASIVAQNADDAACLDDLLIVAGGRANPLKTFAARIGERFGRLKLNGQLSGYSPLSQVVEIEALLASSSIRRTMWDSVASVADQLVFDGGNATIATDARRRSESAALHCDLLIKHHRTAAHDAFVAAVR